ADLTPSEIVGKHQDDVGTTGLGRGTPLIENRSRVSVFSRALLKTDTRDRFSCTGECRRCHEDERNEQSEARSSHAAHATTGTHSHMRLRLSVLAASLLLMCGCNSASTERSAT